MNQSLVDTYINDLVDAICFAEVPPPQEWVVRGLIPVGGASIFSAASKAGKTYLCQSMCIAVARGAPWLRMEVAQSNVLYIDLEVGATESWQRIHSLVKGYNDDALWEAIKGRLWVTGRQLDLTTEDDVKWVMEACKAKEIGLVVIDPISRAHLGTDSSDSDVKKLLRSIAQIMAILGVTVIMIHHFSRAAARRRTPGDRYMGSYKYAADAVSILELDRPNDDLLRLAHVDCRYSQKIEPIVLRPHLPAEVGEAAYYEIVDGPQAEEVLSNAAYDWLLDFLSGEQDEDGYCEVARASIIEAGKAAGHAERTVERVLTKALEAGWVVKIPAGRKVNYKYQLAIQVEQ